MVESPDFLQKQMEGRAEIAWRSLFSQSTALVPLTDAWHFFKWITVSCLLAAILAPFTQIFRLRWPVWIAIFVVCDILRGTVFEFLFAGILLKS